jgi:hypothetical protein
MAGKSKKTAETNPDELKQAVARAQTTLRPSANAAAVIAEFGKPFGEQDVTALMVQLTKGTEALKENNLHRCEAMLFTQAHTLQSIFMNLSRRAALNMGEHMGAMEAYMRLALKAQSQCVRTLEVLGALKNPPNVAFVNQANIAHGPQQVNNGAAVPSPAREIEKAPNELLEAHPSEQLREILAVPSGPAVPVNIG